ncbi:MAG TPA: protein kinase, partial [Candidatus Xenobia bacterium]
MLTAGHILQQRFLIERVLGQGGMGAVYLARHLALGNRSMAIKEMTIDIADTEKRNQAVAQFLKEAQILAGLDHPNLVRVQDFFEEEGRQYLVMDYVEGKNLEDTMIEYDGFLPV